MSKLYVYAKPDQMEEHRFSDDVAITYAKNEKEAINKFSLLYKDVTIDDVKEVDFNHFGVAILTDY